MPNWTIRHAAERDFEQVLSLWDASDASASVTDTQEGLGLLLATDSQALLVAESQGAIVGSLIAAWDGWRASFYRLAVHPDWRRQGLATALLRAGEQRLRSLGAIRLTAIVVDDSPDALGFWHTAGYSRQANRARFIRAIKRQ